MIKKNYINIALIIPLLFSLLISTGCKKEDPDDTVSKVPIATTGSASTIGQNRAILRGEVDPQGISTSITFEYDTTITFETSIISEAQILERDAYIPVNLGLQGLKTAKTYYYRIIAENSEGKVAGSDTSFTTLNISDSLLAFNSQLSYGSVEDIDGNTYKTIDIGTQTWMAENLETSTFTDGSAIPLVIRDPDWEELDTLAYSWFDTDSSVYGALYNWYAVSTEMLCPDGWSVPDEDDWTTLVDYLGGGTIAGKLLKESGDRHWLYTTSDVTNESGFTALPGGYRNLYGTFGSLYNSGYFWTSTEGDASNTAKYFSMYYGYSDVDMGVSHYKAGYSVRCIKDPVTK